MFFSTTFPPTRCFFVVGRLALILFKKLNILLSRVNIKIKQFLVDFRLNLQKMRILKNESKNENDSIFLESSSFNCILFLYNTKENWYIFLLILKTGSLLKPASRKFSLFSSFCFCWSQKATVRRKERSVFFDRLPNLQILLELENSQFDDLLWWITRGNERE